MLNIKKSEKSAKIQNLEVYNSLYNFGRGHSQEYAWFFGKQICCAISGKMSFEVFFSNMAQC